MTDGNDLLRRIGRAGGAIDPAFTERDVQRLVAGARRRARRRKVRRLALGGLGVGAAAIVLALRFGGPAASRAPVVVTAPAAPMVAPAAGPLPLRLADGSVATPLDAGTALALREDAPQRVIYELARGRGHFEVAPRPERQFVVRAGEVTVTVLGTAFTVERVADRIGVTVERGTVMVDWRVGSRRLVAGENGWFPPLVVEAETEAAAAAVPRTRPASRSTSAVALPSSPARASLALTRRDPPPALDPPPAEPVAVSPLSVPRPPLASRAVSPPSPSRRMAAPDTEPPPQALREIRGGDARGDESERPEERESAATLLAAADAARLDGRPADGAALLRRLLREHRNDPRAPLAAFTLGRVLLKELDRPRQAAAAFAEARALAPRGPFAEDALAREVEAWSAAGETGEAAARAQGYLRRYPNGRRAAAMRAVVGE